MNRHLKDMSWRDYSKCKGLCTIKGTGNKEQEIRISTSEIIALWNIQFLIRPF